jgi:1,4-alpha-glucan branching enzyme
MVPTTDTATAATTLRTYHFCVVCPTAEQVFLIGDFNDRGPAATPMEHTEENVWQLSMQIRESEARAAKGGHPPRFSYRVMGQMGLSGRAPFGTNYCLPGTWSALVRTAEKSDASSASAFARN